ncbi:zinc finger protein 471-like, partial [Pomacea canaliculata]|uniref:zinc finger protein 471-like n=1 Tax=Pomacea canaliculata TaxID=400727 RepID=UPI000D726BEE
KRLCNLKQHAQVHRDEKPHECSVCKAAFKRLSHLKGHMQVHRDERFTVMRGLTSAVHRSVCKAAFKRLSDLKQHRQIHSNKKPYQCNKCKSAFKKLNAWKQQERITVISLTSTVCVTLPSKVYFI